MGQRIHLIAIGGAIMHQMAIALHRYGNTVTGSDDKIMDPSRSNLKKYNLLPMEGWDTDNITSDIDLIILGMHAKVDNPELLKAQELGIPVKSFPEYVYDLSKDKKRVVVGGSHGKTSTTAMIMHVLNYNQVTFDYLVGSKLDEVDYMVELSDAPLIVIEGDEYLTSPLDRRPKFHWYKPHISILTGVSIDHVNVFPTEEIYNKQFEIFLNTLDEDASVYYYKNDTVLADLCPKAKVNSVPYQSINHIVKNGITFLTHEGKEYPLKVFGQHMLQNMQACFLVCRELGMEESAIYKALSIFGGTARRMEVIKQREGYLLMRDFAHSPSKLVATVKAVKEQFPDRELIAFFELHTFSSVQKNFLPRYKASMHSADKAVIYMDRKVFEQKGKEVPSDQEVKDAFGDVRVISDKAELYDAIRNLPRHNITGLFMSSGTFSSFDFKSLNP